MSDPTTPYAHNKPIRPTWVLLACLWLSCLLPATAQETLSIPGLSNPVKVVTDQWGVPHIYAQNEEDLFFAQGFYAARDRTFQFELWRRQATGTVAEILGPRELKRDIGTRLFCFRGDMETELRHYHPRGKSIITAFVNGVNAWIALTEKNPSLLSPEFRLLGIKPGKWTPEIVVSRHQGLLGNIGEELSTARAVALLGPEKVQALSWFHPHTPDLTLDPLITRELLGLRTSSPKHVTPPPTCPVLLKLKSLRNGNKIRNRVVKSSAATTG